MLNVQNLVCAYEKKVVINNLSFSLDPGLHVILGQNGSGKTTFFRGLVNIIRPIAGEVLLDGENVLSLSPKKRARLISVVLGSHKTLAGITGEALAEMTLYSKSGLLLRPTEEDRQRIRLIAGEMGIAGLLDVPLEKMSSGERQMLSLLAAEVQNTPVMLLDEPTSSLDYNRIHEFMSRAKKISKEKILVCTLHDPALAVRYADRIMLIKNGDLVGDFSPNEVTAEKASNLLRQIYPNIQVFTTEKGLSIE